MIDTNTSFINLAYPVYPLGLDYLQGSLFEEGFENVEILDLAQTIGFDIGEERERREKRILETLKQTISQKRWDIIGVGIRNIDSTYQWKGPEDEFNYYLPEIKRYIECIMTSHKEQFPIILGGSGFSLMSEEILNLFGEGMVGVEGPGETSLIEMIKGFLEGRSDERFSSGDKSSKIGRLQNIGLIRAYFAHSPRTSIGIRTKNGCGSRCHYCPYPQISHYSSVTKPIDDILREIHLIRHLYGEGAFCGFPSFMFTDDIFNFPLNHAKQVLRAMIEEGEIPESWQAYITPRDIDEEFIELVIESHGWSYPSIKNSLDRTVIFPFDLDSGSSQMLKRMGKDFTLDDVHRSIKIFEEVRKRFKSPRIEKSYHFLFGYLGENEESIRDSCMFIKDTDPDKISIQVGVRIYPQTPLAEETKGIFWHEKNDLLKPTFIPVDRNTIIRWFINYLPDNYILLNDSGDMATFGKEKY